MYQLRNTSNVDKKVELKRISPTGGVDSRLSAGAIYQNDSAWAGLCLAPKPVPDTMYFLFFPWWSGYDDAQRHIFDMEIDGVLYDFTDVENLGENQWYPEALKVIDNIIKIGHFDTSYPRLFIRNVTANPVTIKLIARNDLWKQEYWGVGRHIHDDGHNHTVKYHDNGDIEFTLAPYVPYDQVPEENKFIIELEYGTSQGLQGSATQLSTLVDWYYVEGINEPGLHKDDYMHVEWDDGTVWHHRFADHVDSTDNNKQSMYVFWGEESPVVGRRTAKIWTSHPLEFFMVESGVKVIQWGRYISEEMYQFTDPGNSGDPAIFESIPKETPSWISWLELDDDFKDGSEINIRAVTNPDTSVEFNTHGVEVEESYRYRTYFLDWYRPNFKVLNASINWGTYPEDYPALGFTDLDQLAMHFKADVAQGRGLQVSLDFQSAHLNKMIGSHRPLNVSDYVTWTKIEGDVEHIIFLLDLKKYKQDGLNLNDFMLLMRGSWATSYLSGSITLELEGWLNSSVTLGPTGLSNVPATKDYQADITLQVRPTVYNHEVNGELFGIMDYDTKAARILPKPPLGIPKEQFQVFQRDEALDVLVFKGTPGESFSLTCGLGSNTATHQTFNYTIGDSGFIEHMFDFDPVQSFYYTTSVDTSLVKAKEPADYTSYGYIDTFDLMGKVNRYIPMDLVFEVDGVAVSPVSPYATKDTPVPLTVASTVSGRSIMAKLLYTSAVTGKTHKTAGKPLTGINVPNQASDRLILSIPKTKSTNDLWFITDWQPNLRAHVRFVTPGEYFYTPPYSNYLTFNPSWQTEGQWRPTISGKQVRADGIAENQLVEIILYDETTRTVPKGTITLVQQSAGTIIQRGTFFKP